MTGIAALLVGLAVLGPIERPIQTYEEPLRESLVRSLLRSNDDSLRSHFRRGRAPYTVGIRFLRDLMPYRADRPDVRALQDRMLDLALSEADRSTVEQLVAGVTEKGSADRSNAEAMDRAFLYAMRSFLRKNDEDARKATALLTRFAQVVPRWPIIDREGKPQAQNDPAYTVRWDANGLWGEWYHDDPILALPWLWAWDYAGWNAAMKVPGVSERIEKDLLRRVVDRMLVHPPGYGNMDATQLEGIIPFARVLPDPGLMHRAVRWCEAILVTGFHADGLWHEGTPAYHAQIVGHMREALRLAKGYSDPAGYVDPVDGSRFDRLDLEAKFALRLKRADEAAAKLIFPDGSPVNLHDGFPVDHRAPESRRPKVGRPTLLGAAGHASLGFGEGTGQTLAHLHFAGFHGHDHQDSLSVLLWGKNTELFSETMYRPLPGDVSTREWHEATAAHNTVVIDGREQSRERRSQTPDDEIPGIPDGRYRWKGHGDSVSDGSLLMFAEGTAGILQVVEARAERVYRPRAEIYRRTLALVKTGPASAYVIDVFRVRGGRTHDWMLHGTLQRPYVVEYDRPLAPREGTLGTYLKDLRSAKVESPLRFDIKVDNGPTTRVRMMNEPGMEVIDAVGPAMRRQGPAHFVAVRHAGPESLFAAVHEPIEGDPTIKSVEFRRCGPMAVAVRVELVDGRTDLFMSTMDEEDGPPREVPEWGAALLGRVALARTDRDGKAVSLELIRGASFRAAGRSVEGAIPHRGEIVRTTRTEDGAPRDTLATSTALPAGTALRGRALIMDFGDLLTQSLLVDRVESEGGRSLVAVEADPGITVGDGLIKLRQFPNWGIRGTCRFVVDNPRSWTAEGK